MVSRARLRACCETLNLCLRRYERWSQEAEDRRCGPKTEPKNKLTEKVKEMVIKISNSTKYKDKTPWQIVPQLADNGHYVASESSFYRILKEKNLLAHREKSKPRVVVKPLSLIATGPNQIWSWDITYLPTLVRGQFYYLYMFMDIFSRYIVGARVYDREGMDLSSKLISEIYLKNGIKKGQIYLHSDNGGSMKGATMLATLQQLGVVPSFSRPSVSNDNPFSESLFKTTKFCPLYPSKPFESLEQANEWTQRFIGWYNEEHLHSSIKFSTPGSRHRGEDKAILNKRKQVYIVAKKKNPERWSRGIKNFDYINGVKLNPGRVKLTSEQCLKKNPSSRPQRGSSRMRELGG